MGASSRHAGMEGMEVAMRIIFKTVTHSSLLIGALSFVANTAFGQAENTATGTAALLSLTTGNYNTADGFKALEHTTTGSDNTAVGRYAVVRNTTGNDNTALGMHALQYNV